jgi:hypothetical protein
MHSTEIGNTHDSLKIIQLAQIIILCVHENLLGLKIRADHACAQRCTYKFIID